MRSTFVECPQKAYWEYFHHYKPIRQNEHLHAGKAWAAALEAARLAFYSKGESPEYAKIAAIETLVKTYGEFVPPDKSNKTPERLLEALGYYFSAFPLETDAVKPYPGKHGPMVEFSFALPLDDSLRHPETGEPIIYAGRADMIATYAGAVSIYDDKTTSALGSTWAAQWNLRSQFSGYAWAARAFNIPVTQVVVRGIAILKTEIKHAQAITVRTPQMVESWHKQCVRDIRRAISLWEEGYFDRSYADACTSYGGCMFQQPCMAPDPSPWLENNYAVRIWNPVTREETEDAV